MQIEFLVRYPKFIKNQEVSEEDRTIQRIINGEEPTNQPSFSVEEEYRKEVLDIDDIRRYSHFDKNHVATYMKDGSILLIKQKYRIFKFGLESITGKLVRNFDDYGFEDSIVSRVEFVNDSLNKPKRNYKELKTGSKNDNNNTSSENSTQAE